MSGPPTDISANELFLRLTERPRPSKVIPFPALDDASMGIPGEIRIQVLRKEDHDRARLMAHQRLKTSAGRYGLGVLEVKDMASPVVQEVLADLAGCEILALACMTPKSQSDDADKPKYVRVFPDGDAVSKVLSADEIAVLFSAYLQVQHDFGPYEPLIAGEEDVSAWIRRLVEGADTLPFLRLSSPQWAELLNSLALRLYTLSDTLTSQWSSLPESSQLSLAKYCMVTTSSGEPAVSTTEPQLLGLRADSPIDFDTAVRMATKQKNRATAEEL